MKIESYPLTDEQRYMYDEQIRGFGMALTLSGSAVFKGSQSIENLEKALENYKKLFSELPENDAVVKALAYIDDFVDSIKSNLKVMDTADEVGDESDNIVKYTIIIEKHLVELHRFYGGNCWQLEKVSMEMSTALHDLLTAYNLY